MKRDEWTIDSGSDRVLTERLTAMLNQPFAGLTGSRGEGPWELSPADGWIRCSLTIEEGRDEFCAKTGAVLAEYMVTERETNLLRTWIQRRVGARSDDVELDVMVSEAMALLDGDLDSEEIETGKGRNRRIRKWGPAFASYLKEHGFVHLEGFIRFRLKDYGEEISEAVETAVEERIMERQYQEFVELLQTMVERQEARIPAVHVLHSGGHAFKLLDEKLRPLEREAEERVSAKPDAAAAEDEQEEESLLVSWLLAASPRHLYIHTPEPEAQVIRTLVGIFGERAAICTEMPT